MLSVLSNKFLLTIVLKIVVARLHKKVNKVRTVHIPYPSLTLSGLRGPDTRAYDGFVVLAETTLTFSVPRPSRPIRMSRAQSC